MRNQQWHGEATQGSGVPFCSRIKRLSGYITQATINAITCKVFDLDGGSPSTVFASPTVTVADSVFDTLQTESGLSTIEKKWPMDNIGYNFLFEMPASTFPKMKTPRRYRVLFIFDPASGEDFIVNFNEVLTHPADIDGL